MTRILSYNIQAGGYNFRAGGAKRTEQICTMIQSVRPDVIGLIEAIHPQVTKKPLIVEEIAEQLAMRLIRTNSPHQSNVYQMALLTRLPVKDIQFHPRPGILLEPLLEVCVEEASGQQLTVFVTHLMTAFSQRRAGDHIRQREVQEILRIMEAKRGTAHLLMGDFNSLAPGDRFRASALLGYIVQLDRMRQAHIYPGDGNPDLHLLVPSRWHILNPLLHRVPSNRAFSRLFDVAATLYAPRGCVRLLLKAGYKDCFRLMHPGVQTFTCPSAAPAGRIDYIFASPELAQRLSSSTIITEADGVRGDKASDHLPVFAEFGMDHTAPRDKSGKCRRMEGRIPG